MLSSIKVQLKVMRVSREFRIAMLISFAYAAWAFMFCALEARGVDLSQVEDANQYVCFSPLLGVWNIFMMIYPFIVVMPFATSYISDYKNRILVLYASRVSRKKYYISKLIAAGIGSALVVAIPFLINLLLCNLFFPHNLNTWRGSYPLKSYCDALLGARVDYIPLNEQLPFLKLFLASPALYNLLYLIMFAFLTGLFGILAMACSFVIRRTKILVYILIYALVQIMQNVDGKLLSAAIDGKRECYLCINLITYFLPHENNSGFAVTVLLTEIGMILLVIFLCSVYAINDDIRSVQ